MDTKAKNHWKDKFLKPFTIDHLLDEKYKQNKGRYLLQTLLTTISMAVVLMVLDTISNTVIIAALGASCFIAFTMPHKTLAKPRHLLGGYMVGTLVGLPCGIMAQITSQVPHQLIHHHSDVIFGALAVGISMFLMVISDTEHAPAAGLALGYVLNQWTWWTVLVVFIGITTLTIVKTTLKGWLIDLL